MRNMYYWFLGISIATCILCETNSAGHQKLQCRYTKFYIKLIVFLRHIRISNQLFSHKTQAKNAYVNNTLNFPRSVTLAEFQFHLHFDLTSCIWTISRKDKVRQSFYGLSLIFSKLYFTSHWPRNVLVIPTIL